MLYDTPVRKLHVFTTLILILCGCTSSIRGSELSLEYYNLGNAYYDLQDYDKSILYYRKAISIDGENKKACYNLAMAYIAAGRAADAQEVLGQLLEQDPDNQSLQEALAFALYSSGDSAGAIEIYRKILREAPMNTKVRYNLGMLLWEREEPEAALDAFSVILENNPEDLEALYHRGELLLELRRLEEAAEVFEAYLQSRPDSADAYMNLADTYKAQERFDRALDAYAQVLVYDDTRAEAWFFSAAIRLTKIEDPDRGLTALSEALEGGFQDLEAIEEMWTDPALLEADKVEALLKRAGVLPIEGGEPE